MNSSAAEKIDLHQGEVQHEGLPGEMPENFLSPEQIVAGMELVSRKAEDETGARVTEINETAKQLESQHGGEMTMKERGAVLRLVTEADEMQAAEKEAIDTRVNEAAALSGFERPTAKENLDIVDESLLEKPKSTISQIKEMRKAGREVARLEALLSRDSQSSELQEQLAAAKSEYETKRIEYVGDSVERMLATQERQIMARREFLEKEKGFGAKVYDTYKKLGELNLERAGWKPDNRALKIVAKMASVRTLVSLGLVGVSAIAGAGAAVGIAAIVGRRVLSGIGGAIGTYDLLQARHESKLSAGYSAKEISELSREEVVEQMEKIEANALAGGKSPRRNEGYQLLKARLAENINSERELAKTDILTADPEPMKTMMQATDVGVDIRAAEARKDNLKRKGVAAVVGAVVGSGFIGKALRNLPVFGEKIGDWFASRNMPSVTPETSHAAVEQVAAVVPSSSAVIESAPGSGVIDDARKEFRMTLDGKVETIKPPTDVVPPSEKMLEAGAIQKGDSYARVISRDLMAEPEKYGYDPEHDGPPATWAKKMSAEIMRKNGLVSSDREMRLRFDPTSKVLLKVENGQIVVDKVGVKDYVHLKHVAAPSVEATPTPPAEPEKFVSEKPGAPVTVETEHLKVSGNYESTGSRIEPFELGYVEHEFKPLSAAELSKTDSLLKTGFEEKLGKGAQSNPELVKHLFDDRRAKLFSLKEGYEAALREGKNDLAERLRGDYNVLAKSTNRDIGDVFKSLPKPKESIIAVEPTPKETITPPKPVESSFVEVRTSPSRDSDFVGRLFEEKSAPITEQVDIPSTPLHVEGGSIKFVQDAVGNYRVDFKVAPNLERAETVLRSDWLGKYYENYEGAANFREQGKNVVIEQATRLNVLDEVMDKLKKQGGNEKQLAVLKRASTDIRALLKANYGDLVKKRV